MKSLIIIYFINNNIKQKIESVIMIGTYYARNQKKTTENHEGGKTPWTLNRSLAAEGPWPGPRALISRIMPLVFTLLHRASPITLAP